MCNLYANTMPPDAMRALFGLDAGAVKLGNAKPFTAIYPKYDGPVLRIDDKGFREVVPMHWGFVMPQKSKKTGKPIQPKAINNTRDDKVRSSRFWKKSFETRRCLVPATSFCEAMGRAPADYHWFGVDGRQPFCFAGIWAPYRGAYKDDLVDLETYSFLTTTPNDIVKPVHPDRMPVILDPADYEIWLTGSEDDAFGLLKPFSAERMAVIDHGLDMKSEPIAT